MTNKRIGDMSRDELMDYIIELDEKNGRYERKLNKLQFNWNSLRECIIGVIEGARCELNTILHTEKDLEYKNLCSKEFNVIRKNLEIVLDKMSELERKK